MSFGGKHWVDRDQSPIERLLQLLVLTAAIGFILMYIIVALLRMPYPFELEWMEGNSVDHVWRVMSGRPLYVAPTMEFVPSLYPPLYYYVSAAVAWITGIGPLPLRIVSFASSLVCIALIGVFVWRETRDRFAALVAAGLFAATYRESGIWLDIARVDSLFLAFTLGAVFAARFGRERWAPILAATLTAAAFLTKQIAILPALALLLYFLVKGRRQAVLFSMGLVVAAGIPWLALNGLSEGWLNFYALRVPFALPWHKTTYVSFWARDIMATVPILFALAGLYVLLRWKQRALDQLWFYLPVGVALFLTSYIPRMKEGGFDNDLIPAYAALAVVAGVMLVELRGSLRVKEWTGGLSAKAEHPRHVFRALMWMIVVAQFGALLYNPLSLIPTEKDRKAGWDFVEQMRAINGPIWVPYHGYLPLLAGKTPMANLSPIANTLDVPDVRSARLRQTVETALGAHEFRAIFLDGGGLLGLKGLENYTRSRPVFEDTLCFWPVTGCRTRPEAVYEPVGIGMR